MTEFHACVVHCILAYVEEAISLQLLHDYWDQNCRHIEADEDDVWHNYQGLTHYGRGNAYPREHCQRYTFGSCTLRGGTKVNNRHNKNNLNL